MKPYGRRRIKRGGCKCPECSVVPDKGAERMRVRSALLPALGPVPPSVHLDTEPPCTCDDCKDPAFAVYVRELEKGEHDHLDAIG